MNLSPTQEEVLSVIGSEWTKYDSADVQTVAALARRNLIEERPDCYQARRIEPCRCVYPDKCFCPPEAKAAATGEFSASGPEES